MKSLSTIAEAAYLKNVHGQNKSAWRLHTHFDIDRGLPTRIDVTGGKNSGKSDEKDVLRARLEADHCYVMDRWFAEFKLLNDIHAAHSSYIGRVRDNSRYQIIEVRPLSNEALPVGVLSDEIVKLGAGSPQSKKPQPPSAFDPSSHDPFTAARQEFRRQDRSSLGRHPADRHEPIGCSGGDYR